MITTDKFYHYLNLVINFILILFLVSFVKCTEENHENTQMRIKVENYIKNLEENPDKYYSLIFNSKKSIFPVLIDYLDKAEKGYFGYVSSLDSYLPPYLPLENYIGMKSAYLIEFILSKENFKDFELSEQELRWKGKYNIFYYKIIMKISNNQKQKRPLVLEEMIELKSIYKEWWRKNRNKSIEELREDWKYNIRPLTGSPYSWF